MSILEYTFQLHMGMYAIFKGEFTVGGISIQETETNLETDEAKIYIFNIFRIFHRSSLEISY